MLDGIATPPATIVPAGAGQAATYGCNARFVPSSWDAPAADTPAGRQWSVHLYILDPRTDPETVALVDACATRSPRGIRAGTLDALQRDTAGRLRQLSGACTFQPDGGQFASDAVLTSTQQTWIAYLDIDAGSGTQLSGRPRLALTSQVLAQTLVAGGFTGRLPAARSAGQTQAAAVSCPATLLTIRRAGRTYEAGTASVSATHVACSTVHADILAAGQNLLEAFSGGGQFNLSGFSCLTAGADDHLASYTCQKGDASFSFSFDVQ